MAFTLEQCCIRPCSAVVPVVISRNGGLPKIAADGYSGLTDDGDPVCRDHFCPTCGNAHSDAEAFELCEFYGRPKVNLTPCNPALVVVSR
jgi:hypothetical protein